MNEKNIRGKVRIEEDEKEQLQVEKDRAEGKGCFISLVGFVVMYFVVRLVLHWIFPGTFDSPLPS